MAIELRKVRVVRCTEPRTTPGGSYPVNLSNFSLAFEPDFIIQDAALDKVQDLFAAGKEKMDKVGWQNSYAFEASNAKPPLNY